MLVLTRRFDEAVICKLEDGREITVRVQRIAGSTVRLSFEGPPTVKFLRDELDVAPTSPPRPLPEHRGAVA